MIRGKVLPRPKPDVSIMASIHNRFDIEVVDAKTGKVKQRAKAENVICDSVWANYTNSWQSYLHYGSGNGTPSSADTALFKWEGGLGLGSSTRDDSHIKDGYISVTRHGSLSETTAVGVTITELGLATSSSNSGKLCTHAMLQDMNGNPVSILKTATDIINLYATVFFHWDSNGYNDVEFIPRSSLPIGSLGSSYFCFAKGKSTGFSTNEYISSSYNASTRTYTATCPRLSVSQMNHGGFQYAMWGPFVAKIASPHRVVAESVATGDGVTVDFATKFDLPSNAVVYVDGVVATDVTVSEEPLGYDNMGQFFWAIDEASTDDNLLPSSNRAPDDRTRTYVSGTWHTFGMGLFYNPYHDRWGIDSYSSNDLKTLLASNDLVHWETVYDYTDGINNPISNFRNYKYWKTTSRGSQYSSHYWTKLKSNDLTGKNIHFATPPAEGSVITIDYDTPFVPKDSNHVYDFKLQVQVGPYIS